MLSFGSLPPKAHQKGLRAACLAVVFLGARITSTSTAVDQSEPDIGLQHRSIPRKIPAPLRDRMEDLPLLVQAFINEFNARNGRSVAAVDPAAMGILEGYSWPGNVRELRNVIEHATILATDRFIETKHLPAALWEAGRTDEQGAALKPGMTVDEAERRLIRMTLDYTHDNKTKAASLLGFSLKTLYNKLKRLKLPDEDEGEQP